MVKEGLLEKGWVKGGIVGAITLISVLLFQMYQYSIGLNITALLMNLGFGGIIGAIVGWVLERFE